MASDSRVKRYNLRWRHCVCVGTCGILSAIVHRVTSKKVVILIFVVRTSDVIYAVNSVACYALIGNFICVEAIPFQTWTGP
jgi:hypothetical protein